MGSTTSNGGAGGSTSTSSGTGGSTEPCLPGDVSACYSGPSGTKDKGICKGGTRTCKPDGTFGTCVGEVKPAPTDDCETPLDENCDGTPNEACGCTAGEQKPCYTGPDGTAGVGLCKGGMQTCNAAGTGYGTCMGQVTPQPEDCATAEDEDCDGKTFDDADDMCVCLPGTAMMCTTSQPGVCAAGNRTCKPDGKGYSASCVSTTPASTEDCTTATTDENCDGVSTCNGGTLTVKIKSVTDKEDAALAVAVNTGNDLFAGGFVNGTYAGNTLTSASAWIGKYNPAGGPVWEKTFAATYAVVNALATDAVGNVYAVGGYNGTLDFGNGATITSDGGGTNDDAFLVKLDPGGTAQWARSFGAGAVQTAYGVAAEANGNVFVCGAMQGSADFGGGSLTSAGGDDAFIAKFDTNGAYKWAKRAGDGNDQRARGVAVMSNGDAVLVGEFEGQLNFGTSLDTGNGTNRDVFVIRFKASDGGYLWGKKFGDGESQSARGVAVDSQGNVLITGDFEGNIDFGGGNVPSAATTNTSDVFVAKLNGNDGGHLWSKGFGTANDQIGRRVAVDKLGNVVVTGSYKAAIDFGGGNLVNPDPGGTTYDIFVAKLKGSDGSHVWSKTAGDNTDQYGADVAVDALGNVIVAGGFQGTTDFGAGPVTSQSGYDIFAIKLRP